MRQTIAFGNIRAELARRNYGVKDVAEILGVDRSTVGAKLSGKREFSVTEAFKMSACLFDGLPLEYLFAEKKIERGAVNTTLSPVEDIYFLVCARAEPATLFDVLL